MAKDYIPPHIRDLEDDDVISKTQLKNEAKTFHAFGKQLIELSNAKLALLPLSETSITAVNQYHIQSGNIARKRHLAYIGKCLRHDEGVEQAKTILAEGNFAQFRPTPVAPQTKGPQQLIEQLLTQGDDKIQVLLEENSGLERQTLRQLVRNAKNAKTDAKKLAAREKLQAFLLSNGIS